MDFARNFGHLTLTTLNCGATEAGDWAIKLLNRVVADYIDSGNKAAAAYYEGVRCLFTNYPDAAQENFEAAREKGFDESSKVTKHLENLKSLIE